MWYLAGENGTNGYGKKSWAESLWELNTMSRGEGIFLALQLELLSLVTLRALLSALCYFLEDQRYDVQDVGSWVRGLRQSVCHKYSFNGQF
jgi:hypothetical protein